MEKKRRREILAGVHTEGRTDESKVVEEVLEDLKRLNKENCAVTQTSEKIFIFSSPATSTLSSYFY